MKFSSPTAELFIPDGLPEEQALARTTHIAIGAHQDDLEIMAADGILRCFQQADKWFTGVVVTNGAGSPRGGLYKNYADEEMRAIRNKEQKKAAVVGEYAAQALLDYPSSAVKDRSHPGPVADIMALLRLARPQVVYTHSLADKHDTHVGVAVRVIQAMRSLAAERCPPLAPPCEDRGLPKIGDYREGLYGCEVWRDLDWLVDEDKIAFDVTVRQSLQAALLEVFDSQISGGKRYDLATMGRRRAHATYHASHGTDVADGLTFAMDLTPLVRDPSRDIAGYAQEYIDRFAQDVRQRVLKFSA